MPSKKIKSYNTRASSTARNFRYASRKALSLPQKSRRKSQNHAEFLGPSDLFVVDSLGPPLPLTPVEPSPVLPVPTYRAPIPFDEYLTQAQESAENFHNCEFSCEKDIVTGITPNPEPLMQQLVNYARTVIGLGPILDSKKSKLFDVGNWQAASSQTNRNKIQEELRRIAPLTQQPIVLYRGYGERIDEGDQPQVGTSWDFGMRSCTLSQTFANLFVSNKEHPLQARIDVLPRNNVIPLFNYFARGKATEFEIVVLGEQRVHVVDPTFIKNGHSDFPLPPLDTGCHMKKFHYERKVDFYFILSETGSNINYYPNFDNDVNMLVGGGKAIRLNDNNKLGFGNPESIISAYIASRKPKRVTKKMPLVKLTTAHPAFRSNALHPAFERNAIAAGAKF